MDTGSSKASEAARFRTAVVMTAIYVGAAVCFGCGIWYSKGQQAGFEFFAGYLVEQSLSVDNLFVFLMLFNYFQVSLCFVFFVLGATNQTLVDAGETRVHSLKVDRAVHSRENKS